MDGMRCVEIDKMVGRTETYRISMAYSNYTTLYVVTNTYTFNSALCAAKAMPI